MNKSEGDKAMTLELRKTGRPPFLVLSFFFVVDSATGTDNRKAGNIKREDGFVWCRVHICPALDKLWTNTQTLSKRNFIFYFFSLLKKQKKKKKGKENQAKEEFYSNKKSCGAIDATSH